MQEKIQAILDDAADAITALFTHDDFVDPDKMESEVHDEVTDALSSVSIPDMLHQIRLVVDWHDERYDDAIENGEIEV